MNKIYNEKGKRILYNLWTKNPHTLRTIFRILRYEDLWIDSYNSLIIDSIKKNTKIIKGIITETSECTKYFTKLKDLQKEVYTEKYKSGIKWKDSILHELLLKVLTCIYEPKFETRIHGYRPGRSVHTAIKHIRKDFRGMKWLAEVDMCNVFEEVSINSIIEVIKEDIKDQRFINLLYKSLKVKENISNIKLKWLLINIYLRKLDKEIDKLLEENNYGKRRPYSKEYRRYKRKHGVYSALKAGYYPMDYMSNDYRRMSYIRYGEKYDIVKK